MTQKKKKKTVINLIYNNIKAATQNIFVFVLKLYNLLKTSL